MKRRLKAPARDWDFRATVQAASTLLLGDAALAKRAHDIDATARREAYCDVRTGQTCSCNMNFSLSGIRLLSKYGVLSRSDADDSDGWERFIAFLHEGHRR
jgi:hypothetical protein